MPSVRQRLIPVVVCAVLMASSGSTPAQQAPEPSETTAPPTAPSAEPQEPQPTFRTGVNFVRVDVIVADGESEPVTDLTEEDFEVFEDGELQSIEQFRLIRVDGNPRPGEGPPRQIRSQFDEETEAAREDVRLFLIFLDDYHVRLVNAMSIREPLTRFIETALRPTDMVAVMYPLTPVEGIRFTRDHASIVRTIQRFEGRKFRYEPRNQFEEQYVIAPTETVERIRNQVVMSALEGAAVRLGSLREGRSSLLFVSEGFTVMLPPQLRSDNALVAVPCAGGLGISCNSTADDLTEVRARARAESDLYLRMRDVYTAANRNNMAVYSVDPRGLATGEFEMAENVAPDQDRELLRLGQNTLRALSEETDGRAIVNRNDLADGLAQVVRDASAYYLMGYTSSASPTDGKFHEITVRVKRRGLDVRARKGYWAFTVSDAVLAEAPSVPVVPSAVQQALAAIATSVRSERYVRTWVGTDRAENGKTRVSVVFEPIPSTAGVRREQPGGVSLLAATEQGDLIFRGRSAVEPPGGTLASTASQMTFEADPGSVELRLSVEAEGGGGALDSETRMIAVPDLTASGDGLSTPRVHRARNALELRTLVADATAVPVAARNFSRTERLLIRFDVYNGGTPRATLLNRGGEPMAELTVVPAVAGGTHQIDLRLNSFPPGEYLLEIVAPSSSGEDASELFAVRVSS